MKGIHPNLRFPLSLLLILALLCGCAAEQPATPAAADDNVPYTVVQNNRPAFNVADYQPVFFEHYSELDALGRCGPAFACLGPEGMPTEERGGIGQIKPSGWHTVKYEGIDGKYLYNRCHLIGYQLAGENANEKNLITGTRYLNTEGMLPFENQVADYIHETGCHVLYRVTPDFQGANLLASGVTIEAASVEDGGKAICFAVYCYNRQPGIAINYATGESRRADEPEESSEAATSEQQPGEVVYIINTNTRKFHTESCPNAADIKPQNKKTQTGGREALIEAGYQPCKACNP